MTAPTRQTTPASTYDGLTFLQLQNLTLANIGRTVTDADAAEVALVKALLNEAVARIHGEFPALCCTEKVYSITTVAAQADYLLPMGLYLIVDPIMLDGAPVYSVDTVYANRTADPDEVASTIFGTRMYSVFGVGTTVDMTTRGLPFLTFHPAPDAAGTAVLYGQGADLALAADGDLLRIHPGYISTAVHHAVQPLLATRSRKQDLLLHQGLWTADLEKIGALKAAHTRTRGNTMQFPNVMRSGRGTRFPNTFKQVP